MSRHSPSPSRSDSILSESTLREISLEFLDRYVHNYLPQYLIRISDMRLYSRDELREKFRPKVVDMYIDIEEARSTMMRWSYSGDIVHLLKKKIKHLLRFAIFSHRYGDGEPAFRDMSSKIHDTKSHPPSGAGYDKLLRFCEKAKEYGCDYVWTDTCCINKESSAELEEAIRSMYRWYKDAFVCIIYLAASSSVHDFPHEPWFTRGWTLQELLAPKHVRMYGKDWVPICPVEEENTFTSPLDHSTLSPNQVPSQLRSPSNHLPNDKQSVHMLEAISKVTGIGVEYIRELTPNQVPISEKMRWASKRKTTRVEDVAYSLLGIFNISMPIAYGERHMAFRRLLDAIAQNSQDSSFFAWTGGCSDYSFALPASPSSYTTKVTALGAGDRAYTIQKLGVQVRLLLIQMRMSGADGHYTLEPINDDLSRIMTITRLRRRPNIFSGEDLALGVINFDRQSRNGDDEDDNGFLLAGKRYFCMLVKPPPGRGSFPKTLGKPCQKLEAGGILPMIECKKDYGAPLTTTYLIHSL